METHSKSPPTFSQIEVVASKLATASDFPDGDQEQDRTVLVCVSSKTALQFQEEWEEEEEEGEGFCSQIRTVLSPLQEAKTRGVSAVPVAGFQARLQTLSVWPSRVWSSFSSQAPS